MLIPIHLWRLPSYTQDMRLHAFQRIILEIFVFFQELVPTEESVFDPKNHQLTSSELGTSSEIPSASELVT